MIEQFFSPEICRNIYSAICHSLWQGFLIAFVLLIIDKMDLITKAREKYWLYVTGLVSLFLCFFITIFSDGLFSISSSQFSNDFAGVSPIEFFQTTGPSPNQFSWSFMIPIAWLLGCLFFFMRSILGLRILQKFKKNATAASPELNRQLFLLAKKLSIKKDVKIFLTSKLNAPVVFGMVKPVILFPLALASQLSPKQIEAILLHELIHIKQSDFLINLLQIFIESILYFNPFTWWLSHQVRKYREYYCDDLVIEKSQNPYLYIEALYHAACFNRQPANTAIPLLTHENQLAMRINRMLNIKSVESYFTGWMRLFILLFITIGLLSFSYLEDKRSENHQPKLSYPIQFGQTSIERILPAISSINLKVRNPLKAMDNKEKRILPILNSVDTLPQTNAKIEELTRQIVEKSIQLEKLSDQYEFEMESKLEADLERLEELSERIEEKMEPFSQQWEAEFENSDAFKKLREFEELISEKVEASMKDFEVDESMMEAEIEKLAEELEKSIDKDDGKPNPEKLKEFNEAIHKLTENMQIHSKVNMDFMNDPEIKALQEEMNAIRQEIENNRPELERLQEMVKDEEMKAIQEEIKSIQVEINESVGGMSHGLNKEMNALVREIEKLSKELAEEYNKLEKQN